MIYGETVKKYNPVTDSYEVKKAIRKIVPCHANYMQQAKVFAEYGNREDKILIVRFQQEQKPFNKAEYQGKSYVPLDKIDAPIKGAVRLKEVSNG